MASKTTLSANFELEGAKDTLAVFKRLPKDASNELRDKSQELSRALADKAKSAGKSDSAQSALVATTVRSARDRVPAIRVGGTKRVGRNRVPVYKVLFGAEFGSNQLPQFRPHRGREGYWFFPTVEAEEKTISKAWNDAADAVVEKFTEGGEISDG